MFCSSLARVAAATAGSVTVLGFQSIHANHRRTISCNVEPSQQPRPQQPQKKATISTLKNYSSPAFQGTPVAATLLMHQAVKLFEKQFDGLLEMSPVFVLPEDMPAPESYSKGASGDYDEEDDPTAVHKQFSYSESGGFFGGWASECAVKVPVFEKLDDQEEARLGNAGIRKRPVGSLIMKGKCSYGCAVVQLMYMQVQKLDGSVVWEQDEEDDEAFTTMKRAMSSVFDELGFKSAFHALQQLENEQDTDSVQEPDMDIHETDFSYVVQADLPGVKKVSAIYQSPSRTGSSPWMEYANTYTFEHRLKGVHVVERNTGSFRRSVELADNIIEDEVEASMENGPGMTTLEDDDEDEEGDEEEEEEDEDNDDEEEDEGEQMVLLEDELEDEQLDDDDQDGDDEDAPILIVMEDDDDDDEGDADEGEKSRPSCVCYANLVVKRVEQDDHQEFSHDGQTGSNRVKVVYMQDKRRKSTLVRLRSCSFFI
ncbi:hypothetical protein CcCBS67573_g04027 [Chytriomyces confervae]|uniref:Uncharacterized protein n=1 Tax=Chytriomyces confervae TaxID=246404 RepID=A0A507FHE3_9FUNG|nr:hypothetical protein CcCBS67573_g04027 [Chytriomyces confervae]